MSEPVESPVPVDRTALDDQVVATDNSADPDEVELPQGPQAQEVGA